MWTDRAIRLAAHIVRALPIKIRSVMLCQLPPCTLGTLYNDKPLKPFRI